MSGRNQTSVPNQILLGNTITTRSGSSFNTWFKKSVNGSYESLSDVVKGPTAIKTDKVSR